MSEDALNFLLSGPCSEFTKSGTNDYRDPQNNAFSLSSKGWFDHKTNEGGGICDYAQKYGWKSDSSPHSTNPKSKPNPKPSNKTSSKTSGSVNAAVNLWKQEQTENARDLAVEYLEEKRKIPKDHFADLFDSGLLRCVQKNKEEYELLCPMLTPAQVNQAAVEQDFGDVFKIHRVILKLDGDSLDNWEKKQLGSPDDGLGRLSYLTPLSANAESLQYLVIEGLEDALT